MQAYYYVDEQTVDHHQHTFPLCQEHFTVSFISCACPERPLGLCGFVILSFMNSIITQLVAMNSKSSPLHVLTDLSWSGEKVPPRSVYSWSSCVRTHLARSACFNSMHSSHEVVLSAA